MQAPSTPSPAVAVHGPATTTSAWSYASWALFGLVVLASVVFGTYWMGLRASAEDPLAGPSMSVIMLVGMGAAWLAALVCASLGAGCGLLGVRSAAHRTKSAWAALALNAAFVALSLVMLLIFSPW